MRPSLGHAYLILAAMPLWFVSNLVIGRAAVDVVGPWTLAFLRWLIAALLLLPFAWDELRRSREMLVAEWRWVLLQGFLGMWVCGGVVYVALERTTATNATLIYTATPVLVVLLEAALRGTQLSPARIVGVTLGVLGVITVVLQGEPRSLLALHSNWGDIGIVAAAIAWAVYSLVLKRAALQRLPTLALFVAISMAGTLALLPFMAWETAAAGLPSGLKAWASIIGLAIFPSVLAFLSYQYGVKTVGPSLTSIFMYLLPPYGVVLAVVFLGEAFRLYHAIGLGLVLLGIVLATQSEVLRRHPVAAQEVHGGPPCAH